MNRVEFIQKIFTRFAPELNAGETIESRMSELNEVINTGLNYDYEKSYFDLLRQYTYKTTPSAKIILEILNRNKISTPKVYRHGEGLKAIKNGVMYDFVLTPGQSFLEGVASLKKRGFTEIFNSNGQKVAV